MSGALHELPRRVASDAHATAKSLGGGVRVQWRAHRFAILASPDLRDAGLLVGPVLAGFMFEKRTKKCCYGR